MTDQNQNQNDRANEPTGDVSLIGKQPKWKWHILPKIMREVFSEPVPESELEALQMMCIKLGGIRRESTYACSLLREIRDELRKIRNSG
jgi:hypothetical protein